MTQFEHPWAAPTTTIDDLPRSPRLERMQKIYEAVTGARPA